MQTAVLRSLDSPSQETDFVCIEDEVEMIEFEFVPLPPLLFDANGANDIQGTFTILSAVLKYR